MSLNIKNEQTCRLAGELAELTGETMTGAITVALRERLEREKQLRSAETLVQELHAIGSVARVIFGPVLRRSSMVICFTMIAGCQGDHRYVGCPGDPSR